MPDELGNETLEDLYIKRQLLASNGYARDISFGPTNTPSITAPDPVTGAITAQSVPAVAANPVNAPADFKTPGPAPQSFIDSVLGTRGKQPNKDLPSLPGFAPSFTVSSDDDFNGTQSAPNIGAYMGDIESQDGYNESRNIDPSYTTSATALDEQGREREEKEQAMIDANKEPATEPAKEPNFVAGLLDAIDNTKSFFSGLASYAGYQGPTPGVTASAPELGGLDTSGSFGTGAAYGNQDMAHGIDSTTSGRTGGEHEDNSGGRGSSGGGDGRSGGESESPGGGVGGGPGGTSAGGGSGGFGPDAVGGSPDAYARGGRIKQAKRDTVPGPDDQRITAKSGEFMLNKDATNMVGHKTLAGLNAAAIYKKKQAGSKQQSRFGR